MVLRTAGRWLVRCLAVVGLGAIVLPQLVQYSTVISNSMRPTLIGADYRNGDGYLIERITFRLREPRRWELVAYRSAEGVVVVKRIVGLPGEVIRMTMEGEIIVDGKTVVRPEALDFIRYYPYGALRTDERPADCGDAYFVLGDRSIDSRDSRYIGTISRKHFIGRPWVIVSPLSRSGFLQ